MSVFPFLAYVAVLTSAVLIVMLASSEDLGRVQVAALAAWCVAAAGLQFLSASQAVAATGLVLQTVLAVYLLFRWKLSGLG